MPYTNDRAAEIATPGSGAAARPSPGGYPMAAEQENSELRATRLISTYLRAADDGLNVDSVMLCEVIGEEIQTVALRVAADPMKRMFTD